MEWYYLQKDKIFKANHFAVPDAFKIFYKSFYIPGRFKIQSEEITVNLFYRAQYYISRTANSFVI